MAHAHYAIGLNLHQPYGNLVDLLNAVEWELRQVVWAYERPLRYVREGGAEARLHIAFSGTLLMQLADPGVQETVRSILDIEWLLRECRASRIEFLGSGYTHPVFPLIPEKDWDAQLGRYLDVARPALGRSWFPGFWPPEMGFSMEKPISGGQNPGNQLRPSAGRATSRYRPSCASQSFSGMSGKTGCV